MRVRVLTNSLLSTDVPAVHAGYRRYRVPLLEAGVELYEVKPLPGKPHAARRHAEDAELRAVLAAREGVRVRSQADLHRLGELRSPLAASQHGDRADDRQSRARAAGRRALRHDRAARRTASCWRSRADGERIAQLVWKSVKDGKPVVYDDEPGDDRWREFLVDLYGRCRSRTSCEKCRLMVGQRRISRRRLGDLALARREMRL